MLLCSTSVPFGRGCSGASLHLDCWEPQQKCGCSDVCLDTEESQGRAEQRGKPIPPQCFGLIEVVWEPPGPNNTSAEEGQGLTKRASNQCETPLKLGFQSVRFALFCASSKNYLSIIDLSSLRMFQFYLSFAQVSFFIPIFFAIIAQAFPKEFYWRKSSYWHFCPICSFTIV